MDRGRKNKENYNMLCIINVIKELCSSNFFTIASLMKHFRQFLLNCSSHESLIPLINRPYICVLMFCMYICVLYRQGLILFLPSKELTFSSLAVLLPQLRMCLIDLPVGHNVSSLEVLLTLTVQVMRTFLKEVVFNLNF